MKKLTCLLLVCIGLILLAACTVQPSAPSEKTEQPEDSVMPAEENAPENENAPESTFDPFSEEFSILIDGQKLQLGNLDGTFPWETSLLKSEATYWSSDGFDCFEILCTDGTILNGLRTEGMGDETNGFLLSIFTENPDYQSHRGAHVSMTLDDFLKIYPEAERRENTDDVSYAYSSESSGLSQLVFWFENDTLISIAIANGIDGYLY